MEITKELLEQKAEELLKKREELLAQANAVNGALENIEFLLGVLEQKEEPSLVASPSSSVDLKVKEPAYSLHAVAGGGFKAEPVVSLE
jgi:hypothetical protein